MYVLLCMNQISKITLIYWTRIQRKGCVIIAHVLMQTCVLQSWVFVVAPTHSAPPYCGAGFVHVLSLSCVPPPHVTVHVPQEPQLLNPPSTVRKCGQYNIMGVGWRCFWNYSNKKWSHLLGQWWALQAWVDEAEFGHGLPLYCGAGLVHVRVRDWEPPPHVTEHVVQDPQVAHWPSTVTYNKR